MTEAHHVDVLIVGAGISGIGAGCHLTMRCPDKTFALVEARERLGGTWDLFRYPGIRSDSDMQTLGYSFRPWTEAESVADGPAILRYLRETAAAYGVDRRIRYGLKVERASWSTGRARWTVEARRADGARARMTCRFLLMCSGYYNYDHGYTPRFEGVERFGGQIVHPQRWPEDLDYAGRRVVVIGSGATAVTLVPELAKQASHVTMLQRSPTYVLALPRRGDRLTRWIRRRLSPRRAYAVTRWKSVLLGGLFFAYCRRFPQHARALIKRQNRALLGDALDVDAHFTPRYEPWDQRLCVAPDADLFRALRSGRASVVTDHIERFTETGVALRSGAELPADIIVTATGLQLQLLGGATIEVDGARVEGAEALTYKGMMFSGVPNFAVTLGYTNASWTLKCDLTCEYVCRLLRHMDRRGYVSCCPQRQDDVGPERPLIDLSSGYVQRTIDALPRQGERAPWRLYQSYPLDLAALRYGPLEDGVLEFSAR